MAKTYETVIDRFDGGISEDPRANEPNKGAMIKHFDLTYRPGALKPNSGLEPNQTSTTASSILPYTLRDFSYNDAQDHIVALGTKADGTGSTILWKTTMSANWTVPNTATAFASIADTRIAGSLTRKASNNQFYFFAGTDKLATAEWDAGLGFYAITTATTDTTIEAGGNVEGVQAKDAEVYMAYDDHIARVSSPATDPLDVTGIITSLDNYGNYLAIAAAPANEFGRSFLYLWDLVSADPIETVDFGPGKLKVIANLGGTIIGISDEHMSDSLGNYGGRIVFRAWNGGEAQIVYTITTRSGSGTLLNIKEVKDGRVFFWASLPNSTDFVPTALSDTDNQGIWSFGRNRLGEWALTMEIDTSPFAGDGVQGFGAVGNYWFVAHAGSNLALDTGSVHKTRPANGGGYSSTSSFETQIFSMGHEHVLEEVELLTEPLIEDAYVELAYRVNSETAWTNIFTRMTEGAISTSATRPAVGEFKKFHELQFLIISTGGAIPTRLRFRYKRLNSAGDDE